MALPKKDLYIALVKHKTHLRIDEEGTEATAATSVEMTMGLQHEPEKFSLVVDRPFIFALYKTNFDLLLMLGQILDPPSI